MEDSKYRIYKVSLPSNIKLDIDQYDSYSEFIVVAENEDEARMMHPGAEVSFSFIERKRRDWISENEIHLLIIEEIGFANQSHQCTEILTASFHAG